MAGRWVHFAGSCPNDVALGGSPDRFTAVLVWWDLLDSRQEIERGIYIYIYSPAAIGLCVGNVFFVTFWGILRLAAPGRPRFESRHRVFFLLQ